MWQPDLHLGKELAYGYKMVWLEPHFLQEEKRVLRMFTGWTWEVPRGKSSQEGAHADVEFSIWLETGVKDHNGKCMVGWGALKERCRCLSWGQTRQVAWLPATRDVCHTIFINPKLRHLVFLLKAFQSDCGWKASLPASYVCLVCISWLLSFSSFLPSTPSPVGSWRGSALPHSRDIYNFLFSRLDGPPSGPWFSHILLVSLRMPQPRLAPCSSQHRSQKFLCMEHGKITVRVTHLDSEVHEHRDHICSGVSLMPTAPHTCLALRRCSLSNC